MPSNQGGATDTRRGDASPFALGFEQFMRSWVRLSLHQLCGLLAIALGLIVLLGWGLQNRLLLSLPPFSNVVMKVNTALCFVATGLSLFLVRSRAHRRLCQGCSCLVGLLAGLTLLQYASGLNFGIDQLLVRDRFDLSQYPGRMSDQAAVVFLLFTAALVGARSQNATRILWSQILTLIAGWITLLGLFGYILNVAAFYLFLDSQSVIAANTLIGFLICCIGILGIHPYEGFLAPVNQSAFGRRMSRMLLPWLIVLPLLLHGANLWSQANLKVSQSLGTGWVALMTSSLLIAIFWLALQSITVQEQKILLANQAAQEISRRFQQIVMQAPQPMVLYRSDGRILEVNEAWQELSGFSLNDTPTVESWFEKVYGSDKVADLLRIAQAMYAMSPGQRQANGEFVIQTRSGMLRTWEFYSSSLGTDTEGYSLILSTAIDITERVIADRQLRDLSENLERLVQIRTTELESIRDQLETAQRVAKVGSWAFEIDTQTIEWSPQLFRLFGMDPSEPVPSFEEHQQQVHPLDRNYWLANVQQCIEQGIPYSIDFRVIWPDGSLHWVSGQGEVVHNADGQAIRLVGTAIDITDRKATELRLEQAEARTRLLIDQTPGVVYVWPVSNDPQLCYVSPQVETIIGGSIQEWQENFAQRRLQAIHPDDRPTVTAALELAIAQEQAFEAEYRVVKLDGSITWLRDQAEPITDAQTGTLLLQGIAIDVTSLKQTEEKSRLLIEQSPGIVYVSPLDQSSKHSYISPQIEPLLGVPRERWIAGFFNTWQQYVHPDDRDAVIAEMQSAIQKGHPFSLEYRMFRADGQVVWVRDQGDVILSPEDGTPVLQGLAIDITELKTAEQALQQRIAELNQRNTEMRLLGQLNDFLQACSSVEEASQVIAGFIPKLFPNSQGQLSLLHTAERGETLQAVVQWGEPTHNQLNFVTSDCWALRRGSPYLYSPGKVPSPACQHLVGAIDSSESILCLPMTAFGDIIGHLQFEQHQASDLEQQASRPLAETVAEQLALAIANLQLRETLRQENLRDPLTGLFNRRYLQEFFEQELARASRSNDSIGILMIDIDHFKQFNDHFGHAAGDLILQQVADALASHVRTSDVVCRYGGEEMTVLMPGASLDFASRKADSIRQAIAELSINYQGRSLPSLTISIGVAAFPDSGMSTDTLLKAADTSLYQAKASGRNCVVVHQPAWRKLGAESLGEVSSIVPVSDPSSPPN